MNEENKLCNQLQKLCDDEGREVNSDKSALIFNELGLLYKHKSPDKIALIQSAALLNAAIARQPDEVKYQDDLDDLCKHVLICAGAKLKEANLVEISKEVAKKVDEMRENVNLQLQIITQRLEDVEDTVEHISMEEGYVRHVQSLQHDLSAEYKDIMAFVSKQCIEIMGPFPCKYALIGMGSIARDEITPYSDFEHLVILENYSPITFSSATILNMNEYFRWYSVLFHLIVLNLQETIIPSVCIPCLNDYATPDGDWFYDSITTRGISFDGMMPHACKFPLGRTQKTKKKPWRTELIKPVNEMVRYLEVDEDLKNGYKLGDILTKTCLIEGNENLYQQFSRKVKKTTRENALKPQVFRMQLEEDLANFDIIANLPESRKPINIKRIIYRSVTLFISALSRLQNVDENSCFKIVSELQRNNLLKKYTAHRLSHAIAVACHVRLGHYMAKGRQDDDIYNENAKSSEEKLEPLTKIVNVRCLTKCLVTAFFLQLMLKKRIKIREYEKILNEIEVWSHTRFLNLLGLNNEAIRVGERYLKNCTKFDKNATAVLFHLVKAYCDAGQSDKSLKLLLSIREMGSLEKLSDLNPHYSLVKRLSSSKTFSTTIIIIVLAIVFAILLYFINSKLF